MKNQLKSLFQSQFNLEQYTRLILSGLLHAQQIKVRPELLEETSDGDVVYGLGIMEDANRLRIGLFYTDVRYGDVTRKRVGLRRIVEPYIKANVDAALAVFDDGKHWRLSFVTDLQGQSTSPKRFSYVMGDPQGQYRTPVERLMQLGGSTRQQILTLSAIRDAFSVEALSDAFFDEYHIHYDRIVAELARQGKVGAIHHDYVKKMMGRIVFLHFLQKKGWLNGNPSFLRDLFLSSPHKADFLEQVLEPLFFGIFNTESEQREKLFANEHWDKDLLKQWEHLPYLNGGLFERDEVDKMNIRLPASLFNDLFTFLASYNFTVDENDPDDAEIGVDPEMLGKIFESLLEDNKAKGAFYTPKEIVRYMCKESLIAYLNEQCTMNNVQLSSAIRSFVENHELPGELEPYCDVLDRALREVKICDPAIGSGAFPMGLLNELWRCREAISIPPAVETQCIASLQPTTRAALKREIIENNIYGVDIERGAIDIARLRFWLSIVVDSEEPQALPNFDYKFMQGNSLIESFEGVDLSRMMSSDGQHSSLGKGRQKAGVNQLGIEFVSTDTKRNLQLMLREYFSLTDHVKKAEARRSINDSVKRYIRQQGLHPSAELRLSSLDPSANQEFFLWHTWFKEIFDKGGFDIVIGNPPYGATINKEKDFFKNHYLCTEGKYEIYKYFFEHATKICAEKGVIAYITPDTWQTLGYFKKMRRMLFERCIVISMTVSLYSIFRSATVDTMVTILQKNNEEATSKYKLVEDNLIISQIKDFAVNNDYIICTNNNPIILKIEQDKISLCDVAEVWQGLIAYAGKDQPRIWTSLTKETEFHRKLLYGRDISKYEINWSGEYLKYGEWLHRPRPSYIFDKEKILVQRIRNPKLTTRLVCAYDNTGYINGTGISNIILLDKYRNHYSIKYLLGILNSKLINYWFSYYFVDVNIKPEQLRKIPLPKVKTNQEIISLVEKILSDKQNSPNADTSALEREIDGLVYELYGLTEEEVKVVEGKDV